MLLLYVNDTHDDKIILIVYSFIKSLVSEAKKPKKRVKISSENIFWYGRSAKMAKTPIQKPVCFFGQKRAKFGNLGKRGVGI
jgi:hypothetical protein